ncbi:FAD-binding protein [Chloroflexota bacterium]
MNYIVLVKQVPDIKNIPEDAWDRERGTLKRGLLDNVCNELDKQALTFALRAREKVDGKVVSLTMGPPFAEEVLRYTLATGADESVLLTDRKLGGADTPATAYALAMAIRKIEKEIFKGDRNFTIVCGMQSIDGDTAQVPPQIAEELGIVHIAYATDFKFNNGSFEVKRITRRGAETVVPGSYPCMVTVTEWAEPLNASFSRTRWAAQQRVYQWNAADVNADEDCIGLVGSKTNVVKVFSPKEVRGKVCVYENDLVKLVKMLKDSYTKGAESAEEVSTQKYQLPKGKKSDYKGDVWVYAEQEGGEINSATFELLGKATELAEPLGEKVGAVLVGDGIKRLADELISYGADKVYIVEHALLKDFLPLAYKKVIAYLIEKYKPQMMLFGATPLGRELGPRVAYSTKSGLTADCTGLEIIDRKQGEQEFTGILMQTRPALGGNVMASIVTKNSAVQMSTARPGVMNALKPNKNRTGKIIEYVPDLTEADLGARIVSAELHKSSFSFKDAKIIVSGGRGLKTKENYDKYIPSLAESLGKVLGQEAVTGASRLAVESGFIDRSHQVGQTGQTVEPKLYVAAGISGAVQHLTGMQSSDIILAINKDAKAPIFNIADYGIVGNIEEVVPELINVLNSQGA